MCGIAGILHPAAAAREPRRQAVERMISTLTHRGPDDEGCFLDDLVALGHRRLSIIDLEGGRQPMSNESGDVWIVFNGEIYNHRDLQRILEGKGHTFRTRSDTEAIVHAYEEWGPACLDRLLGMFAFAIWDAPRRRLFLARDRVGKKPLYYTRLAGGVLLFGSELKALTAYPDLPLSIDLEALSDFLTLTYVPRAKSIFRGVHKLLPGHYLIADAAGVTVRSYWDVSFAGAAGEANAAERVAELLRGAVTDRLESDVPLGAFLSGGIDSSAVVAFMAQAMRTPVITAAIAFPERQFDESRYARQVAELFCTDHREHTVTTAAIDVLDRLIWHYDEPFADSSAVPTYYVAQLARERVTVALSGDGGDESFAGYRRYYYDVRENAVRELLPASLRQPVFGALGALYPKADYLPQVFRGKTFLSNVARTPWEAYLHTVSGMDESDKNRLLSADTRAALGGYRTADLFAELYAAAGDTDALGRIQYIDFKTYLPDDILTKVDRASMASSLEVRCPLLDHRLIEYAAALPSRVKLRGTRTKVILKEALRGVLPSEILERRKMGFAMPVGDWLRGPLRPLVEEDVVACTALHDFFDAAAVGRMWQQHRSGLRDRSTALWTMLIFSRWYRRFMRARGAAG
jgi:asparagine synthase (glutamine-hydrolysing)